MKIFVTGVNGQLGRDVMNELYRRGHEGAGADLAEVCADAAEDSAAAVMPYVSLDIADKDAVRKVITEMRPDAVIHCAAWTAVDMAEDDDKAEEVRAVNVGGGHKMLPMPAKRLDVKCSICPRTMCSTDRGQNPGDRTAKIISL